VSAGRGADGLRHHCPCGHLLGIERGRSLHLHYRAFQVVAYGEVQVRCPRCEAPSVLAPREVATAA
jgi:hypothetical protein